MAKKYAEPIDRIMANSVISEEFDLNGDPCWDWIGTFVVNRTGMKYGRMNVWEAGRHRKMLVHRYVMKIIKGRRLYRTGVVKHLCNNSLCCNPDHLESGSQSANMKQCVRDGRHNSQRRDEVY